MENELKALSSLIKTINKVSDNESGCPWLVKNMSHKFFAKYLIEEAHEACEAIEKDDKENLCEELGDVFLQVLLHSKIASFSNSFNLASVFKTLDEKLIRRHPHVFEGRAKDMTFNEIEEQWNAIKKEEKKLKENKSF